MPRINLLYFGSVLDITRIPSENAEVPTTLDELRVELGNRYPGLSGIEYRFSVNRKMAEGSLTIADGDEIALLPPFAGG